MAFVLLGIRVLLALVFVAAAVSKLRDRRAFASTLTAFDVQPRVAAIGATLIPAIELAAGLLLLPATLAAWGAAACLALLVLFTAATAISLSKGQTPNCACFGAVATEPIGIPTIVRNAVLTALAAGVLVVGPGGELTSAVALWQSATADARALGTGVLLLLAAAGALSLHLSRLRGENARLASRVIVLERQLHGRVAQRPPDLDPGGLSVGIAAPAFDLPRLEGDRVSLASLVALGRPVALIFLSAHCSACHELWPDVERWQATGTSRLTVVEVCSGSAQAIEMKVIGHTVANVLLDEDSLVADACHMSLKPSAVIVSPAGVVESKSVAGVAAIRDLIAPYLR